MWVARVQTIITTTEPLPIRFAQFCKYHHLPFAKNAFLGGSKILSKDELDLTKEEAQAVAESYLLRMM